MTLGVLAIDALAAVLVLIGAPLTFRARSLAAWLSQRHVGQGQQTMVAGAPEQGPDREGIASVIRMVGVMMVAFGVTGCAFANLIAYYTAHPPG